MRILSLLTAVLSILQLCSFSAFANTIEKDKAVQRVDHQTQVYIDDTKQIGIEQVASQAFQKNFVPNPTNLTFGYNEATIWIKLKVSPPGTNSRWYLEIPAPFLEYVDFYHSDGKGGYAHSQAGYYRPFALRTIKHTGHVLELDFTEQRDVTVFIKIAGNSPKTFPLFLLEKEYFHNKVRAEDVGYGIFFGILIVMFFYNFFIFLSLRNVSYLLYILTIVCTFLIFASATGYGGKYLWPNVPAINFYAGRMSLPAQGIVLSIFTIQFLELRKYTKVMYYIVAALIPLSFLAGLLILTGALYSAGNNLISLATVTYMATGIVCVIRGNKIAYYFIAAWTIYLIGGLMLTLRNSGVFDFNFWTTHLVEIGAALETIIIAFALADKYHRLKKEKEEAQSLALKAQQDATEKLELKVRQRTEQLSRANDDLHGTLEKNMRQTKIIEDKNVELDSFFYRISHDLKGPISSLRGLGQLARMEVRDPVALDYIEKQSQQVERLNQIITGLINLTKLNQTDLPDERIQFKSLVDDCIQSFHAQPKYPEVSFIKEIDGNIEFFSQWALVNAILQNLIENAIKYSARTAAFVRVAVRDHGDSISIDVQDNGQGIPEIHQPRIFDMFYRATHNATGTGLGLYILKRSVDKLEGKISLQSKVGAGSTFTVTLPKKNRP
jgi:signal transduction histidine kinase